MDNIKTIIEKEINPVLAFHKGSCEAVSFVEGILTVRLNGGCVGCPSSRLTLFNAILPILQERCPEILDIELA